jgi:hypothetical protein
MRENSVYVSLDSRRIRAFAFEAKPIAAQV